MPPRFFRKFHRQRDRGAIEILNARKARVQQILVDADACTSPVAQKLAEVSTHLELLLFVSDLFPYIARKYGEAKAHHLVVQAMEPCKDSPITKPVSLERELK